MTKCISLLLSETKEVEICRNAAISTLTCRLYEAGLAEYRKIVLFWQCFRDHCTANMLVVQCVLTLSIYCTHFSCQYLFEGIDVFGHDQKSGICSLKYALFAGVHFFILVFDNKQITVA